jgi:hypothetical protein
VTRCAENGHPAKRVTYDEVLGLPLPLVRGLAGLSRSRPAGVSPQVAPNLDVTPVNASDCGNANSYRPRSISVRAGQPAGGTGMSRMAIRDGFGQHRSGDGIGASLVVLS